MQEISPVQRKEEMMKILAGSGLLDADPELRLKLEDAKAPDFFRILSASLENKRKEERKFLQTFKVGG